MKKEIWTIERGFLVCTFETYVGARGHKIFYLKAYSEEGGFYFSELDTREYFATAVKKCVDGGFFISGVKRCPDKFVWRPSIHNTKFMCNIEADLQQLTNQPA